MKIELSIRQQVIPALIGAIIALIAAVFVVRANLAFRNNSVAVQAEYVKSFSWMWADLKFERDGHQVVEGVGGLYLFYSEGEPVSVRLSLTDKRVVVDNFLTNWLFVVVLSWVVLSFGYIGIASLWWVGPEGE